MQTRPTPLQGFLAVIVCAGLLALPVTTLAQVVTAPPTPQIGSSNTVSADPAVKRPHGTPARCNSSPSSRSPTSTQRPLAVTEEYTQAHLRAVAGVLSEKAHRLA